LIIIHGVSFKVSARLNAKETWLVSDPEGTIPILENFLTSTVLSRNRKLYNIAKIISFSNREIEIWIPDAIQHGERFVYRYSSLIVELPGALLSMEGFPGEEPCSWTEDLPTV
jgi:hypothetical protein